MCSDKLPARFGGEGLVFFGNEDPASYPTAGNRDTMPNRLSRKTCVIWRKVDSLKPNSDGLVDSLSLRHLKGILIDAEA